MTPLPTTRTHEDNLPARVSVLVAYEDYAAGKRARRACQQLFPLAHPGRLLSTDLWKFDMLKLSAMRAAATEEANGAELLVVAPQSGVELPDDVREWVQTILLHPSRLKGLLVLAGPAPQDQEIMPPAEQPLEEVAAQLRCPFWCLRLEPPNGEWADPSYAAENLETVAHVVFPPG